MHAATLPFALVAAGGMGLVLFAETRDATRLAFAGKAVASIAFVLVGILHAAPPLLLAALLLALVGDLLLVPRAAPFFRAGIIVFLAAHVALGSAFLARGVAWDAAGPALLPLVPIGALVAWRLLPRVPPALRAPVIAYVIVITAMVALAAGTGVRVLLFAAVLFYASDLLVARDRFVERATWHRVVGLPLYYAAMILFAANP